MCVDQRTNSLQDRYNSLVDTDSGPPLRYSRLTLVARISSRALKRHADGGPHVAGAIAFRVLFSIFPLVIVLGGLFGIVVNAVGVQAGVVDPIVDAIPLDEEGQETFRSLLQGATGGLSSLGLFGVVGLIWAASGMMGALRYGLDRAFEVTGKRPFVQGKLVDVALLLGVGRLILQTIGLALSSRLLSAFAEDGLNEAGVGGLTTWLIGITVPAVLAFAAVTTLYRIVPAQRPRLLDVLPSAAFVGIVYALTQNLFGIYLSNFGNYNAVYGSLGAVIAFLFFVYLSSSLFLVGANAAAATPIVRGELERGEEPDEEEVQLRLQVWLLAKGLLIDGGTRSEQKRSERPPDAP